MIALAFAPFGVLLKIQFFRPITNGLIDLSVRLLLISSRSFQVDAHPLEVLLLPVEWCSFDIFLRHHIGQGGGRGQSLLDHWSWRFRRIDRSLRSVLFTVAAAVYVLLVLHYCFQRRDTEGVERE